MATNHITSRYGKLGRSSPAIIEEYELVVAAKGGDSVAFDILCQRSANMLFNVVRRVMRGSEDAEDIVQESFQQAFIHLKSFKYAARFSTWLCSIATNAALMRLRKNSGFSQLPLDESFESRDRFPRFEIEDPSLDPERLYAQKEQQHILSLAVKELTPRLRRAIELRELDERSTKETAQVIGISVGAVKGRVFQGRRKLGRLLNRFHTKMRDGNAADEG